MTTMEQMVEAASYAIESSELEGYHIKLTALVDNVATYTATIEGREPQIFGSHADASGYVQGVRLRAKAEAALRAALPIFSAELLRAGDAVLADREWLRTRLSEIMEGK